MIYTPPWIQPGWREQVVPWIHAKLERCGIRTNGAIEDARVRSWSIVLRVPTDSGDYYFKAVTPLLAREPSLVQLLARTRPDCIPQLLATDLERHWMLMPDGGVMLRTVILADHDLSHWHRILPVYSELQIELSGQREELVALGAIDRRLAVLPDQYAQLLTDQPAMRLDLPDGLTSEQYRALCEMTPQFSEMCAQLARGPVPETLDHNDFHDGNILVKDGRYSFFDWGDACVTHPFFSMVVTLRSIANRFGLAEDAPEVVRLRDIYLEPWTRFETREHLLPVFDLAQRAGMVGRALTWHLVLSGLEGPHQAEFADAVPGWLGDFLNSKINISAMR
jgi:hypothetical protein